MGGLEFILNECNPFDDLKMRGRQVHDGVESFEAPGHPLPIAMMKHLTRGAVLGGIVAGGNVLFGNHYDSGNMTVIAMGLDLGQYYARLAYYAYRDR
jgi:hypothetical protein